MELPCLRGASIDPFRLKGIIWPAPNQSQGRALAYQVQKSVVLAICTGVSITPVVKLVQVPTKLVQALTKLVQALIKYYRPLIK